MAMRIEQYKIVFAEQRSTGLDVWREPLSQMRIPKFFDLRADPFERGEESFKYNDWFVEHVPYQYAGAGRRARVAGELQGVPAARKGGELHHRPDRREADAEIMSEASASRCRGSMSLRDRPWSGTQAGTQWNRNADVAPHVATKYTGTPSTPHIRRPSTRGLQMATKSKRAADKPVSKTGGRPSSPSGKRPNILVIWGDDIGISNLSCYSHGLMGYKTPNIDRIAREGMMFTDSYGEQSCTAGRSSFITGQSVLRTGLSKVGIPGAPIGMNEKIITIAAALKNQGYSTGQFGKNHLGDLNHMLPTNHGFDEFFGNLYHLNAEEEPEMYDYYPEKDFPNMRKMVGPRGVVHSWATDKDDPDRRAALGTRRQAEDPGHRAADDQAHGDLRRRVRRSCQGFHQAPDQGGQAVLRLGELHAHAHVHAYQEEEPAASRAGGNRRTTTR